MPEDRLRRDRDDVENLEDLIEARNEGTSEFARDVDAFDKDMDIPEDIDVDDALTFPHPKHKVDPNADVDLMDTPRKDEIDINWAESQQDLLPSDYMDDYDDAVTTQATDNADDAAEDEVRHIGDLNTDDLIDETPIVASLPRNFSPEDNE
jgi:hypothetical protein